MSKRKGSETKSTSNDSFHSLKMDPDDGYTDITGEETLKTKKNSFRKNSFKSSKSKSSSFKSIKVMNMKTLLEFGVMILSGNFHWFLLANTCVLITASVQAYIPRICGNMIDAITNKDEELLNYHLLFTGFLVALTTVFSFMRGFLFDYVSEKVIFKLKFFFFSELIYNKISFFEKNKSGELISRFTTELEIIRNSLSDNICMMIRNIIQLLISIFLIFYLNSNLAIHIIVLIIPSVIIIIKISKNMKGKSKNYNQLTAESVGMLSENFLNMKIVKSYNAEPFEINKYAQKNYEAFNVGKTKAFQFGFLMSVINIIAFGLIIYVMYYGGKQVRNGDVSVGELSSFFIYSTTLSISMMTMSGLINSLVNSKSALEKLFDIIQQANSEVAIEEELQSFLNDKNENSNTIPEVLTTDSNNNFYSKIIDFNSLINSDHCMSHNYLEERVIKSYLTPKVFVKKEDDDQMEFVKNENSEEMLKFTLLFNKASKNTFLDHEQSNLKIDIIDFQDQIEFKNVSFSFDKDAPIVLNNVNFQVKKKTKLGIVGESGSGKTTLVNLLFKFYLPNSGEIFIDGMDLKNISSHSIRKIISYVPQEPAILSGTVLSNILYGIEQCNEKDIKEAIEISNSTFVFDKNLFPEGLNTIIGEKGVRLSGGQKQRIAIARAILKNPKIFVFDESTAALDSASETLVQEAIDNIIKRKNCTAIVVSHRLSSIQNCDKIIVIKKGKVILQGTHSELAQKKDLLDLQNIVEGTEKNESDEYFRLFDKQMK